MKSVVIQLVFLFAVLQATAQKVYSVTAFGAVGDGRTDDAAAIQKTIDACNRNSGGTVLLPAPYTFMSGPLVLKSNIHFLVEGGAKLLANPDEKVYTKATFRSNPGEGSLWISAENFQNLTISGGGEINGNGISFMGKDGRIRMN